MHVWALSGRSGVVPLRCAERIGKVEWCGVTEPDAEGCRCKGLGMCGRWDATELEVELVDGCRVVAEEAGGEALVGLMGEGKEDGRSLTITEVEGVVPLLTGGETKEDEVELGRCCSERE